MLQILEIKISKFYLLLLTQTVFLKLIHINYKWLLSNINFIFTKLNFFQLKSKISNIYKFSTKKCNYENQFQNNETCLYIKFINLINRKMISAKDHMDELKKYIESYF